MADTLAVETEPQLLTVTSLSATPDANSSVNSEDDNDNGTAGGHETDMTPRKSAHDAAPSQEQLLSNKFHSRSDLLTARAEIKHDIFLSIFTIMSMGMLFGIFMNKSRVFDPFVIRDQFAWQRMIMLKLFCSAGGTSCFGLALSYFVWREHWECARAKNTGARNLVSTFIGGCMLGVGMALSGACPGMVWVQIGSGIENSIITLAGGFVGALIYGLMDPWMPKYFQVKHIPAFIDEYLKLPYYVCAIVNGIMFFAVAITLEVLMPWKSELEEYQRINLNECTFFDCYAWQPILCGIGVGVLQLPATFILGNTLGSASAFAAIMGQWLRLIKDKKIHAKFGHFKAQLNRWWQVGYVMTSSFGSFFATIAVIGISSWSLTAFPGVDVISGFFGGFLMLWGSRFAKGCTSGHGLSGTALMTLGSFIGVIGMFIGGTAVGLPLHFS